MHNRLLGWRPLSIRALHKGIYWHPSWNKTGERLQARSLSPVLFREVRGLLQRLKMSRQVAFSIADMLFVIVKAQITAIHHEEESLRVPNLWLVLLQPWGIRCLWPSPWASSFSSWLPLAVRKTRCPTQWPATRLRLKVQVGGSRQHEAMKLK